MIVLRGESLNWFVKQHPLLFHAQDWYRAEPFATIAHFGEFTEENGPWPAAAYAAQWVHSMVAREGLLWPDHYRWTSDFDAEGHPVYVGRTAQYGCLQIHRRLTEDIR